MAESPILSSARASTRGGTRVSLDSIVYAFLEGHTAESLQQSFPSLTLEQVYGSITYYLAHREGIDTYLQEQAAAFERLKETLRKQSAHGAESRRSSTNARLHAHDSPFSSRRESESAHSACGMPPGAGPRFPHTRSGWLGRPS